MRTSRRPAAWLALAAVACTATEPGVADLRVVRSDELELVGAEVDFNDVREVVVTPTSIWVLDQSPPFVTRLSMQGDTVVQVGAEGRGPTEFLNPVALQVAATTGAAHVWDFGNVRRARVEPSGRVTGSEILDGAGIPLGRADIRDVSYADPHRIRSVGGRTFAAVFPHGVNRTADFLDASIHEVDLDLAPLSLIVRYAEQHERSMDDLLEFAAVPLWDACEEAVSVWRPDAGAVVWRSLTGEVLNRVDVHEQTVPMELADIARYIEWMARLELGARAEEAQLDFDAMAREHRPRFADRAPLGTDVKCAPGGTVWLQLFDTTLDPLGRGARWLRIESGGSIQTVEFPPDFRPVAMTQDAVYGVYETQGHQRLARWRDASAGDHS